MCSGLAAALPSGHTSTLRDGGKGPSCCASHSPNTHTRHETHTPSAALSLCHSMRFGAEWDSGGSGMGHWGSSVSHRLGKGRWLPSPRLGSSPSQHLPAGCFGGLAVLGTAVTQPAEPGRDGRVCHCSHSTPSPGRGSDSSVATPMAYTRLEDSVTGPGVGGEGWERPKDFNCCPPRPSACPT